MIGADQEADEPVELAVGGMTCGSCAARIERRLNLLDGVEASVNYATERAYLARTGGRDIGEIVSAIEAAGYAAAVPAARRIRRARWQPKPPRPVGTGRPADPLRAAGDGRDRAVHDPSRSVQRLAVGGCGTDSPRGHLGCVAAAPGRMAQLEARDRDHGHAGQPWHSVLFPLVGAGAGVGRGRPDAYAHAVRAHLRAAQPGHDLPGRDSGRHGVSAARPIPGVPREAAVRIGTDGARRARCPNRVHAPR